MVTVREFLDVPQVRKEALEGYRKTGYLILTDLFDVPSELAQMRTAWGKIAEAAASGGQEAARDPVDDLHHPSGDRLDRASSPLGQDDRGGVGRPGRPDPVAAHARHARQQGLQPAPRQFLQPGRAARRYRRRLDPVRGRRQGKRRARHLPRLTSERLGRDPARLGLPADPLARCGQVPASARLAQVQDWRRRFRA